MSAVRPRCCALLLQIAVFIGCGRGDATGALEGSVLDAETGEPVENATVSARVDKSAQTDGEGFFSIAGLAPGSTTLQVTGSGYQPTHQSVDVEADRATTVSIELTETNVSPTIERFRASRSPVEPGATAELTVTASDANDDELSYTFSATGAFEIENQSESTGAATLRAPESYGTTGEVTTTVTDPDGASATKTLQVSTTDSGPPVIRTLQADRTDLEPGETTFVSVNADDPDGEPLSYAWDLPPGWSGSTSDNPQIRVRAPEAFGERGTVEVTVEDGSGGRASRSIVLSTVDNPPPVIRSVSASPPNLTPGGTATLLAQASDPDDEELAYSWSAPGGWSIAAEESAETEVTAPGEYGATGKIEVTVEDSSGGTAERMIVVSTVAEGGPRITQLSAAPRTTNKGGTVSAVVSATGDPTTHTYDWTASGDWYVTPDVDDPSRATVTAPDAPDAIGTVDVVVTDEYGGTARASTTVSTASNAPPTLGPIVVDRNPVEPTDSTQLNASASDPDGDSLDFSWSATGNWTATGSGTSATLRAPDAYGDSTVVTAEVTDGFGGTDTVQVVVRTAENRAPVVDSLVVNPTTFERGASGTGTVEARDPNGDALDYTWTTVGDSGWTASGRSSDPSTATVGAPDAPGRSVGIKVTVEDDAGATTARTTTVSTADNQPPSIVTPDRDLGVDATENPSPIYPTRPFTYDVDARDAEGDSLNYSLNTSSSASIDSTSGEITWMPGYDDAGSYTWTVEVSDGYDSTVRQIDVEVPPDFGLRTVQTLQSSSGVGVTFDDIDGDGRTDFIRSGRDHASVQIVRNTASGTSSVTTPPTFNSGQWCDSPLVGDFDADDDPDIALVCERGTGGTSSDLFYYVWENTGSLNFQKMTSGHWDAPDAYSVYDSSIGDLDGDGRRDDIVVGAHEVALVAFSDGGTFADSVDTVERTDSDFLQVAIADFDPGGPDEIAWLDRENTTDDTSRLQIYSTASKAVDTQLSSVEVFPASSYDYLANMGVGDLGTGGPPDIVLVEQGSQRVLVYTATSSPPNYTLRDQVGYSGYPAGPSQTAPVTFGDLDSDGFVDVAFPTDSYQQGVVGIAFGEGGGDLSRTRTTVERDSTGSAGLQGVFATDWDGDGILDLLGADSAGRNLVFQ